MYMKQKILGAVLVSLLIPLSALAVELPPSTNFDAGKPLKAVDLKALLQGIIDLRAGLTSSLFSGTLQPTAGISEFDQHFIFIALNKF